MHLCTLFKGILQYTFELFLVFMSNLYGHMVFVWLSSGIKGDIMSKPRQIKRRKRKTGYINLVKPSKFRHEFSSFTELANFFGVK